MKTGEQIFAEHAEHRQKMIQDNHNAPVDTLIRTIFDMGCTEVVDDEDGIAYSSAENLLDLWYNLDELTICFTLPNGKRTFVYLVHQIGDTKPSIEDIVDYGISIEEYPMFANALDEKNYPEYFH